MKMDFLMSQTFFLIFGTITFIALFMLYNSEKD